MGIKEFTEKHKFDCAFEGCRVRGDQVFKGLKSWKVAGATAEFEHGANVGSRVTATRVLLAGPFALALKKNKNKVYIAIEFADGEQELIEAKAKDEKKARLFVSKFNQASKHFATE